MYNIKYELISMQAFNTYYEVNVIVSTLTLIEKCNLPKFQNLANGPKQATRSRTLTGVDSIVFLYTKFTTIWLGIFYD